MAWLDIAGVGVPFDRLVWIDMDGFHWFKGNRQQHGERNDEPTHRLVQNGFLIISVSCLGQLRSK